MKRSRSKKSVSSRPSKAAASHAGAPKKRRSGQPFPEKDLLTMKEVDSYDLDTLFKLADRMKKSPNAFLNALKGKSVALLFQKPSIRTRVSFQVGMGQMGGNSVYMDPQENPLGERESIKDIARVMSRFCNAVVVRSFLHSDIEEFAKYASVPVINGLSDTFHPCQTLADLFTIREKFKKIEKMNIAYIGDGNNVLNSLLYGAAKTGANLAIATPRGYEPGEEVLRDIKALSKESGSKITLSNNPFTAIKNAHAVYTDVWVSMGQEKQREQRLRDFQPFQLNAAIVSKVPKDAILMHCLPAHRGQEVTDEVLESSISVAFDQAENRLHAQKAMLVTLFGG